MKTTTHQESTTSVQPNAATGQREQKSALEQAGGPKAMVYSALPVLAFVVANNVRGLRTAIIAATALALGLAVERLARRESLMPALGGVFGVAIAAGISWWTGSAKDYFLIGIWASLAGAVLLLASVLARWPLAGVLWNSATGKGSVWREDKRSRFYYDIATLVLAFIFGSRFVVKGYLYQADKVDALGVAKIVMGYPLLGVGLLVVSWAARCSHKRLKAVGLLPAAGRA
ncbi:DUF3159 domain-containing protein [Streptomyces ureilyticus]|uniref:DUF3159 domain-containing protein n=1 Tax=Streptomyces ureilyticus TaxID=1775131 RepID=A0ABX0DV21_9ACTN|nr:DUF3159 domain-containing protein [Streptomyces ureilyticus]